jgi:hypothetical protein
VRRSAVAAEHDEQLEYGFTTAVFVLDHTAGKMGPDDAEREFAQTTKENFWRMWPAIRDWSEELFRQIDDERGHMAKPVDEDDEYDEVGGGG